MDLKNVDKRIIRRQLESGTVSQKEYQKYLGSLEDVEEGCEVIEVPLGQPSGENQEDAPENEEATENNGSVEEAPAEPTM